jgi:RHS repeat-associated protein
MGNLKNSGDHTYAYDSEGRPVSIDNSVQVMYDAFERPVEQNRSGTYTQILYSPSGQKFAFMNGSTVNQYFVSLVAGMQAVYNGSGLQFYRHVDWLGTNWFDSTPSGGVYFDGAWAPFGEHYAGTGTSDRSFTGQTQDTVTGLYDFPFRQEHPVQGRWLVPDPAGLAAVDITNPQTWNRYAYVGNNPLNAVDPLGLYLCGTHEDDPWCNGGGQGAGGGAPCSNCGANTSWQEFNQAELATFGQNYFLIPGNFGFGSNYEAQLGQYLQSAYKDATLGPNGWIITFGVGFQVPCSSSAPAGCLTGYTYNLFQFTDPTETKSFSFNTSFTSTVTAFGGGGFAVSPLENKYSPFHPFNLRYAIPYCSAHVALDTATDLAPGQPTTGTVHIDLYNPVYSLLATVTHGAIDVAPYVMRKAGIAVPGGNAFGCQ